MNFTRLLFPILVLSLLFLLPSCNHYYYAPSPGHLMALSEKGDVKLTGGIGQRGNDRNDDFNRNASVRKNYSLRLGLSPIENVGIQLSHFNLTERSLLGNDLAHGDGRVSEIALGYYNIFNKKSNAYANGTYWIWDFYAGMGKGKVNNYYDPGTGFSTLKFNKYFIQGGIHLEVEKYLTVSFGFKTAFVDYRKADLFGVVPINEIEDINYLKIKNVLTFWEPTFRIQGGGRQAKAFLSFTSSIRAINPNNQFFPFIGTIGNIGLILEPDEFFRPSQKKKTLKD